MCLEHMWLLAVNGGGCGVVGLFSTVTVHGEFTQRRAVPRESRCRSRR